MTNQSTTKDEALQQALDAAKLAELSLRVGMPEYGYDDQLELARNVVTALQAALAQEEPQRQWQGLTDDDIESTSNFSHNRYKFAREIEAKLKERNQ